MGKVYELSQLKKVKKVKPKAQKVHTPEYHLMQDAVSMLIETYTIRIEELEESKDAIKAEDGAHIKNAKALMGKIKELNKLFYKYGITTGGYRFLTIEDLEVVYLNEKEIIYVYSDKNKQRPRVMGVGEFIETFEYYKFTLALDEAIYEILDQRIQGLDITIQTLIETKL